MHIGFQRSGGRGEYEIVGSHTGFTAIKLEGWSLQIAWPDRIVRDTDLLLEPAGSGKPRLRSLRARPLQIGRQIAAMLMLPDPRREYSGTAAGLPVARHKGYVLSRIGFGPDTVFTDVTDIFTAEPTFVDLDNQTNKETIGVAHRWRRIEALYSQAAGLPTPLAAAVENHRALMAAGDPIDTQLCTVVRAIEQALAVSDPAWQPDTDPLPALEAILAIAPPPGPTLPPPDEIGEEEPIVSARSAHQYRLTKARGAGGVRFRAAIQAAYQYRCAFCGAVLGGKPDVASGVDAAHILAWSRFDLDIIQNGLSLCKLHHWAFDAALLVPVYEGQLFTLKFTELAIQNFDMQSLRRLGTHEFEIPSEWLPTRRDLWPSPVYLTRLYADLAISFAE